MSQLLSIIEENCINKKISISGGEPLEQLEALIELVSILKNRHYNICLYTGFELAQVPENLLENLDYIKTGRYIDENKVNDIQFYGSTNQKLISL